MSNLTVYRASAGSGKTFRLAVEYVKLLIENPLAYKNILAVTFTNKATAEMKERILFKLNGIAQGKIDDFFDAVRKETNLNPQSIKQRAGEALSNILHDYSMFSVSTIDSFVQRIIQGLLWEIGFHSSNEIRLDFDTYVEKAVDRMLDESGDNQELYDHFKGMVVSQLNNDKLPNIQRALVELGKQLYSENFRLLTSEEMLLMDNHEILHDINIYSDQTIDSYIAGLNEIGSEAMQKIESNGFSISDFSYAKSGVCGIFEKASKIKIGEYTSKFFTSRVLNALKSPETDWLSKDTIKKNPRVAELQAFVGSYLFPKLTYLQQFVKQYNANYVTAVAVSQNLDTLRVINNIRQSIKKILMEEGTMLLVDSGPLLREFIGTSDAPFVYEKIGARYDNFLLDEFQDTSEIQWLNFKPLIANSLAEDKFSLVVGDVKQAIYRWRNSDWRIFARGIEDDFPVKIQNLDTNYRSLPMIVSFNNKFFEGVSTFLPRWTETKCEGQVPARLKELVEKVYMDSSQKYNQKQADNVGYVEVCCPKAEGKMEASLYKLFLKNKFATLIPDLRSRGLHLGNIAVVVRTKNEGSLIAEILLSLNYSVMSQDALMLSASHAVRLCISAIKLLQNENDTLSLGEMEKEIHYFSQNEYCWAEAFVNNDFGTTIDFLLSLRNQPLVSVFEAILNYYGLTTKRSEFPYISLLHEKIIEMSRSGAVSLTKFIEWWDENGKDIALTMPESIDSINILTIHKSKGLQFPVVILPFANIEIISNRHASNLWTRIDFEPYSKYPLFPITSSEVLLNSSLRSIYIDELVQTMVDGLNLLYVAFTRPENELYIMLDTADIEEDIKNGATVILNQVNQIQDFQKKEVDVDGHFSYNLMWLGKKEMFQKKGAESSKICWTVDSYSVENRLPKIAIQFEATEFFRASASGVVESIEYGKLMHNLFAMIKTSADVDNAVYTLGVDGLIPVQRCADLVQRLNYTLQKAPFNDWFSDNWQVKSELSIINTDGNTYRPDRVMLNDDRAIVVDFKFGIPSSKHAKQVENYMLLIKQMGVQNVEGYVWYVDSDELKPIAM